MLHHAAAGLAGEQPRLAGGLDFLRGQQGLHKIIRPADDVVTAQPFLQQLIAPDLLLHRHGQRLFQRPRKILAVKRIDDERLAHFLGRAGHFAQNQNAGLVGTRRDEFLGHQVHAVAQRRDERHVAQPVERHDFLERQVAELIDQRRPMDVAKIADDAADRLLQFRLHRLVTVHADARWRDGNDEHHLAVPLRDCFSKTFRSRAAG